MAKNTLLVVIVVALVMGEIIAKDEQTVTVKLSDGGSKIVFFSDTTQIDKFAAGTLADLEIGMTIIANGTANQDGSVVAKTIQLRPAGAITPSR